MRPPRLFMGPKMSDVLEVHETRGKVIWARFREFPMFWVGHE